MIRTDTLLEAIDASGRQGRLLALEGVTGLSGDSLVGMLQRFAQLCEAENGLAYVEVGVFQGLTLTSVAAAAPDLVCYGIDDFSQFDPDQRNQGIVEARLARHTRGNARIVDEDFETALLGLETRLEERQVGCYFVDGPHDYRSQYLCLDFMKPHLADGAVIVVDDANYEHVRRASADWLRANPDWALLFEAYSACHPQNLADPAQGSARGGWWNGMNVLVHDPQRTLERILPPVDESRARYLNDHIVHAMRHAELAPAALRALDGSLPRALLRLLAARRRRNLPGAPHAMLNTYSEAIAGERKAGGRNAAGRST